MRSLSNNQRCTCLGVLVVTLLLVTGQSAMASLLSKEFTLDADFDEGVKINVDHVVDNELRLTGDPQPFPYINIAASGRGTIVRLDVNTGEIIGEFYTSPSGRSRNPSRTTVDQFGNVWVGNRDESDGGLGSVARVAIVIGGTRCDADGTPNPVGQYLKPPFQYSTAVDRDGDGLIKTSNGLGNILAWTNSGGADNAGGVSTAEDECIINYVRCRGTGTRAVAIDANNDVWVGGTGDRWHEKLDGETGQPVPGTEFNLGCGGYGALVDGNGILWSARGLLRYDPSAGSGTCINISNSYGLAEDNDGNIWNTQWENCTVTKLSPAGAVLATYSSHGCGSRGVAVTRVDNTIWIANSHSNTVTRLTSSGGLIKSIPVGAHPTGVAVDANGKVWVTNYNSSSAMRIDPSLDGGNGVVDLTVSLGSGANPYNYSDMTGAVILSTNNGSWMAVYESECPDTDWKQVDWNAATPTGTDLTVELRAANLETELTSIAYTEIGNGDALSGIIGKFVQVRVKFHRSTDVDDSPILYDLTIYGDPPGGVVNGYVTSSVGGTGLMGVPIEAVDDGGLLLDQGMTDENGWYELDVPSGDNVVRIAQMPLGYVPTSPDAVTFTMICEDVQVDFELGQKCRDCQVFSTWFWRWQVFGALCGYQGLRYNIQDLNCLLGKLHNHFDPHFDIYADVHNVWDMMNTLAAGQYQSHILQARAHFFALLLNTVSGRFNTYDVISEDGATGTQAITYIAGLIMDGDPSNDALACGLARALNWEWVVIPAGYIPLDIPQIAYKSGSDVGVLPNAFALSQNYPNPFNPVTEIQFTLPRSSQVSLSIYNIMGQQVATLVEGPMTAGAHTVQWDGNSVATGVYFYRLKAEGFTETKKMVLLK